jgi:hypothetical protein
MRQGEMRKAFVQPLTESSRVALAACWVCGACKKKLRTLFPKGNCTILRLGSHDDPRSPTWPASQHATDQV